MMAAAPPANVATLIVQAAQKYGVPPNLALEVANQESGFDQSAKSPAGAIGVMQLMPATAAGLGVDPTDVSQNIQGGVQYLAQLLAQFGGDISKALAAYNWGPGNVSRSIAANGDSFLDAAPAETKNYVASITGALGTAWTATVTPSSVAAGAADVASTALDSVASVDSTPLFILTAVVIGGFFVLDWLLSD
jgi:soluble lytic murein transglycosylase-like protein